MDTLQPELLRCKETLQDLMASKTWETGTKYVQYLN